jgi:hypothetical protein
MNKVPTDALQTATMKVPRQLDSHEVGLLESKAVAVDMEIESLLAQKKTIVAEYNARVKLARTDKNFLHTQIKTAVVEEEVTCFLVPNYKTGVMEYMHQETAECIKTRPLTAQERQLDVERESRHSNDTTVSVKTGTNN